MKTKILGEDGVEIGAQLIKAGESVAFATETVYGLGADAFNEVAVKKIFIAKERSRHKPLIIHLSKIDDIEKVAIATPTAVKLLQAFAPGPLAVVLQKNKALPSIVTAGMDTVGIRIPRNNIARALIEKANTPIAGTSANVSNKLSPTTAQHVYNDLQGRIPLIIDGGECSVGIESTVLDLTKNVPTVLRLGAIPVQELSKYLPKLEILPQKENISALNNKNNVPIIDCVLAENVDYAIKKYEQCKKEGKRAIIVGETNFITDESVPFIGLGKDSQEVGKNLYSTIRKAQSMCDLIILQDFKDNQINLTVCDRIKKITQGKMV